MSQWVEIRHLYLVEGVAKKRIARRLQLDIKTVRRALEQPRPPVRVSSPRVRSLDPWREQIAQWLAQDRRVTAKRIRRLLLPLAGPVAARTVRRYVAALKVTTARKEGYVHRSVRPGTTMEVDFGESWAEVAGGQVPGGNVALRQRVFRQGVSGRAARVAARRDCVGVHVFRRRGRPGGARQHVVGGQAGASRPGPA